MVVGSGANKAAKRTGIGRELMGIITSLLGVSLIVIAYLFMWTPHCLFSCTPEQNEATMFTVIGFFAGFALVIIGVVVSVTGSRV